MLPGMISEYRSRVLAEVGHGDAEFLAAEEVLDDVVGQGLGRVGQDIGVVGREGLDDQHPAPDLDRARALHAEGPR
jgi:hypothetical protein